MGELRGARHRVTCAGSDLQGEGEEANASFNSEFITTSHKSQQPVQHGFNNVNMLR